MLNDFEKHLSPDSRRYNFCFVVVLDTLPMSNGGEGVGAYGVSKPKLYVVTIGSQN